jgi:hypothetical protein
LTVALARGRKHAATKKNGKKTLDVHTMLWPGKPADGIAW